MTLTLFALLGLGATVYFIMHFATDRVGLPMAYWFVPLFGATGGAVGGVLRNDNKLALCKIDDPDKIFLGVIGDIAVGLGGSCAVVFLFGNTIKVDPKDGLSSVLLVSISFIAGAFGKDIVELAGKKLLAQARREARSTAEEEVAPSATIAYAYAATQINNRGDKKELPQALKMAEQALKYDQTNIHAYVEKGRTFKLLGNIKAALDTVEAALRIEPNDARLRYNRACYMALLKMNTDEILADLKQACVATPLLCEAARLDTDLDGIRNLPQVREFMLRTIEEALRSRSDDSPEAAALRYSRACYMALLDMNLDEILADLKKAFIIKPKLREQALIDPGLESVRSLPEFRKLFGDNSP